MKRVRRSFRLLSDSGEWGDGSVGVRCRFEPGDIAHQSRPPEARLVSYMNGYPRETLLQEQISASESTTYLVPVVST